MTKHLRACISSLLVLGAGSVSAPAEVEGEFFLNCWGPGAGVPIVVILTAENGGPVEGAAMFRAEELKEKEDPLKKPDTPRTNDRGQGLFSCSYMSFTKEHAAHVWGILKVVTKDGKTLSVDLERKFPKGILLDGKSVPLLRLQIGKQVAYDPEEKK